MQKLKLYKPIPWLVLVTGLAVTYLLQQAASDAVNKTYKTTFDFEVKGTITRIKQRLYTNEQILLGVKGLFVASKSVNREEFQDYITQLELPSNYHGIQAIDFAPIVTFKEKNNHINVIRNEGFPQYNIFPEGEREFYTPLVFLEPFAGRNLRAFGFDTYSNSIRRAAMDQARDADKAVMTSKVKLVQDTEQEAQAGFIIYLPIYRNASAQKTEAERRANITGWVNSSFRMNDLMQGIMREQNNNNIDFQIFDGERIEPETLMYQSFADDKPPSSKPTSQMFQADRTLKIFGHVWTIKFYSLSKLNKADIEKINYITLTGVLLSILLSLVIWQLINARKQALALANRMTRKLQKSEKMTKAALAETQQQWHAIDEHAILVTLNIEGKITFANDKFCRLSGYQLQELVGQKYQFLNWEAHPDQFFNDLIKTIATDSVWHGEICNRAKNGNQFWLLTTVASFFDEDGKPISYTAIHADITPLKQAEDELKESVSDKEALLKEVYHRVKNNLQVVSSLMNLQLCNVKNEEMVAILRESINRVKSMALIHESLYQTTNLAHIDFHHYAENLINHLIYVYGLPQDKVKIEMDVDAVAMDADTAIPCGLIINELVSNALKYAFPGGRQGIIRIVFKADQDKYFLSISDNGIGFPKGVDINNSETLGLQLVSSLSNQLMGEVTMDNLNGTSVIIRFRPAPA